MTQLAIGIHFALPKRVAYCEEKVETNDERPRWCSEQRDLIEEADDLAAFVGIVTVRKTDVHGERGDVADGDYAIQTHPEINKFKATKPILII